MTIELDDLLAELADRTRDKFARKPAVVDKGHALDVDKLPIDKPEWHRLTDLVSVVFDLKSSTNLEKGRRPASTASIYDASVGGAVKVLNGLGADFVDIQGDGGFGLFWGDGRYERAMCAAISIRTFSDDFTEKLTRKWPDAPSTGFKIGVASGPILAKRVGLPRHLDLQEPVWAGRPVNYAAKAAQQGDPQRILITGSVWDEVGDNDYIAFSCGCSDGETDGVDPCLLWEAIELDKIPDEERLGQALKSAWCTRHGQEFCNAILNGETWREEIPESERSAKNLVSHGTVTRVEGAKVRIRAREELRQGSSRVH